MILLALETKQAQFLRGLIDLGIRTRGTEIARNALILDDMIVAAMQKESKENANVVTLAGASGE